MRVRRHITAEGLDVSADPQFKELLDAHQAMLDAKNTFEATLDLMYDRTVRIRRAMKNNQPIGNL